MAFTTQQLVKLDESIGGKCLAYHTIGTIARYTESEFNYAQKNGPGIANYVKLGAYYYAFSSPQEGCSANQNFLNLESQQTTSLATKLSTLQTIAQ